MRRKLKLEMLDDYVSIFRIIYFCRCSILENSAETVNEVHVFEVLENDATSLKNKYELIFQKFGLHNPSFLLFRRELSGNLAAPISDENKQTVSEEKLKKFQNRLKMLKFKQLALMERYHKKLAK